MSILIESKESFRICIVIITILTFSSLLAILNDVSVDGTSGNITESRSGSEDNSTVPDFDVQFMIDPATSPYPLDWGKSTRLETGMSAEYWILVSNFGDKNNSYHLRLDDPPIDIGWQWYFIENGELSLNISLTAAHIQDEFGGRSFQTFRVYVKAPIDARTSRIDMSVKAEIIGQDYLDSNTTLIDRDELTIALGEIGFWNIPFNLDSPYIVEPNEWIEIDYWVTNLVREKPMNYTVRIEEEKEWRTSDRYWGNLYSPRDQNLEFNWTEINISVHKGTTCKKTLSVRVPISSIWNVPYEQYWDDTIFRFRFASTWTNMPQFKNQNNNVYYSEIIALIVNNSKTQSIRVEDVAQDQNRISLFMDEDSDGILLNMSEIFTDSDGKFLSYSISGNNDLNVTIDDSVAHVRSIDNWFGWEVINITATDGEYEVSLHVNVTVIPINDQPYGAEILGNDTYFVGEEQTVYLVVSDPDLPSTDYLTAVWTSNITGFIGKGQQLNLSLPVGIHEITVMITDLNGLSTNATMVINIQGIEMNEGSEQIGSDEIIFPWVFLTIGIISCLLIVVGLQLVLLMRRLGSHN